MEIKKIVKSIITFFRYPIVSANLLAKGSRAFYIGPRMRINRVRDVFFGSDVSIGSDSRFLLLSRYYGGCYSPMIKIGNRVSIGNRFSALSADSIIIEDDNLIASDVLITSENHGMNPEFALSYAKMPLISAPVVIRRGCWIGEKVSIMPGVEIGERSIIAANAVVTRDIPPYSLAGGIPAKVIKQYDFDSHTWRKV